MSYTWPPAKPPTRSLPEAQLLEALQKPPDAIDEATVQEAVTVLREMRTQGLDARERLDQKAALTIPAVGAVGTLVSEHLNITTSDSCGAWLGLNAGSGALSHCFAPGAGLVLVVAAVAAVGFSLACLWPSAYSHGPDPVDAAWHDGAPIKLYRHAVAASLAASVVDIEDLVQKKARRWQRAIIGGSVAVGSILMLGVFGGLK